MNIPGWPPRDWRALLALIASVAGAGVLTANRIWLVKILERTRQWPVIGNIALMDTFIIGIVLVSLGLAINKRSVKGSMLGASFEASGGDDAPAAAQAVADSAQSKADDIKETTP